LEKGNPEEAKSGVKRGESIAEWVLEAATVPPELAGARLDLGAARLFEHHSRARLQDWIRDGHLRVNSRVQRSTRERLRAGDELRLKAPRPAAIAPQAQKLKLDVVHADDAVVVLNKPAGLTVHPGAGQPDGTLVNALLHRFPQVKRLPRAGLVHRLDKDTSGLLVVALTERAHARLVEAMQARRIRREYDAVVAGIVTAGGTVRAPIGRHPRDRVKQAVLPSGRPSVTHYRVLQRFSHFTHLRLRLETGRTHQIRVHLQYIRHPVLGDPVYGGRAVRGVDLPPEVRQAIANFPRQALHARELEFQHPVTGATMTFVKEPPEDMQRLLDTLRAAAT
jgi:23S rRNA pseudouridine1911/1915/1917 synthase